MNQSQSTSEDSKPGDFDAVRKSIVELLRQPDYDDGSAGPVLVRLAWYVINQSRLIGLVRSTNIHIQALSGHI